jgi:hypothetical protein
MTNIFKKVFNGGKKLFNKVSHGAHQFFKKDGILEKGLSKGAHFLGDVAQGVGKGLKVGEKVLNAVVASPFGAELAPVAGLLKSGLNIGSKVANVASTGSNALGDALNAKRNRGDVGQATSNILEKAKQIQNQAKAGPVYV